MEVKKNRVEPKGLGDTLKEIFDITGVTVVFNKITNAEDEECSPCKKRQELLNKLMPYKNK